MFYIKYFSLVLIFISTPGLAASEKPEIFLCVREDSIKTTEKKLVYGYIYGVKTECMTEKDFLELYAKKMAEIEKSLRLDTISNADAIILIQNGEKDLRSAKFQSFDFMDVSFKGANCTKANFYGADLRNASFRNANCTRTNFSNAFIKNVDFRNADVTAADFTGTYISGADFVDAKGVTPEMFNSSITLYKTKFNKKLAAKLKKQYPDLFEKPKKCWETNTWVSDSIECDETSKKYKFKKIKK